MTARREFKASCHKAEANKGVVLSNCAPEGLPLEFTDPALYAAHMEQAHNFKSYAQHAPMHDRTPSWVSTAGKPWKPSRASKLFEAKPLEPGADVTWKELVDSGKSYYDGELGRRVQINAYVERTGQVWSLGWNKAVWVVPYQPWRDELAVLLKPSLGELRVCQVWPRSSVQAAAA